MFALVIIVAIAKGIGGLFKLAVQHPVWALIGCLVFFVSVAIHMAQVGG